MCGILAGLVVSKMFGILAGFVVSKMCGILAGLVVSKMFGILAGFVVSNMCGILAGFVVSKMFGILAGFVVSNMCGILAGFVVSKMCGILAGFVVSNMCGILARFVVSKMCGILAGYIIQKLKNLKANTIGLRIELTLRDGSLTVLPGCLFHLPPGPSVPQLASLDGFWLELISPNPRGFPPGWTHLTSRVFTVLQSCVSTTNNPGILASSLDLLGLHETGRRHSVPHLEDDGTVAVEVQQGVGDRHVVEVRGFLVDEVQIWDPEPRDELGVELQVVVLDQLVKLEPEVAPRLGHKQAVLFASREQHEPTEILGYGIRDQFGYTYFDGGSKFCLHGKFETNSYL
ncbi:hypothetical protein RRG08_046448 [Elysia crispata]|uniref:Uncharacterized protein n=1 Tax=Elysia crispata TaxID=231223 RepID=A0AAE1D021_9GAST|nr:hypothetical protein RRG08_046448 [Elysia crispata]